MDQTLWPAIASQFGAEEEDPAEVQGLDLEVTTNTRSSDLRQDVSEAIVKNVKVLTAPGEPEKRSIELQLPTDMPYRAGDYLAILPLNSSKIVKRVMNRFGLPWDARIRIKEGQNTILPTGREMSVFDLLSAYVELNQPATTKVRFHSLITPISSLAHFTDASNSTSPPLPTQYRILSFATAFS